MAHQDDAPYDHVHAKVFGYAQSLGNVVRWEFPNLTRLLVGSYNRHMRRQTRNPMSLSEDVLEKSS